MDTATGEMVAITEWVLKWRHIGKKAHTKTTDIEDDIEGNKYQKQVNMSVSAWVCALLFASACVYVYMQECVYVFYILI